MQHPVKWTENLLCSQNTGGKPSRLWEGISPLGFDTQILNAGFQSQICKPKYIFKNSTFLYKYSEPESEGKTDAKYM